MTTSFKSNLLRHTLKGKKGVIQNGFTLIEMMVVVVIIGVLSAVGAGSMFKAVDASKDTAAKSLAVSEAKVCAAEMIYSGSGAGFTAGSAPQDITYTPPTCAADASFVVVGPSQTWTVDLTSGIPGAPVQS